MKALVLTEVSKFTYMDVETPLPGPGEVQINVKACGICGSDFHGYDGSSGRRVPPIIIGHEASGIISAVGEGVKRYKVGDAVVFQSMWYCRDCEQCHDGTPNRCDNGLCYGVNTGTAKRDGAMCEYVVVPEYMLYRIPEGVDFNTAALIEPMGIALHAVEGVRIHMDDTALVYGAGLIGTLILKFLKASSAGRVIVVELDENKKELARKNGADEVIDGREDVPARVKELTGGKGCDIAFEAIGIPITVKNSVLCLKKGGTLVQVGNVTPEASFPLQYLVFNEITIKGVCYSISEYEQALNMLQKGTIDVSDCISACVPLKDGQEWFDRLHAGEPGLVKVVLNP